MFEVLNTWVCLTEEDGVDHCSFYTFRVLVRHGSIIRRNESTWTGKSEKVARHMTLSTNLRKNQNYRPTREVRDKEYSTALQAQKMLKSIPDNRMMKAFATPSQLSLRLWGTLNDNLRGLTLLSIYQRSDRCIPKTKIKCHKQVFRFEIDQIVAQRVIEPAERGP